jgi:ATP-binding cassette subfamily C protein LapB
MTFINEKAVRGGTASLPVVTIQIYDRILPNPDSGTLPVLIAGVCVAVAMEFCLRLARGWIIAWNGAVFDHRVSCDALSHLLFADLSVARRTNPGEYLNRLAGIGKLKDFFNGYTTVTMFELILVPVYLILIFYIAGPLVLAPVGVLAAFTLLALALGTQLRASLNERSETDDKRYDFLLDCLEGMHTLKSFCLEDAFTRRYEWIEKQSARVNYRSSRDASSTFNAASVFSHLMSLTVVSFGALRVMDGQMTSGALIAATLLSGRIMQPVQRTLALWVRYQDYSLAHDKVAGLFALPSVRREARPEPAKAGHAVLRHVAFNHGIECGELFRGIDLQVHAGEAIRITGSNGTGKTHLLGLMAGIYIPNEGSVLIDGLDPLSFPYGTLRQHIGLLKSHGEVFRGTIRDNLTSFGSVGEDNARRTTRLLGIEREVARLPRGFDTFLDEQETGALSPGLRQRIAIARVLAWNPGIILFDNADRNLDRNGYRAVYRLLVHLKTSKALVMVTEDPNFAALADRHLHLKGSGLEPAAMPESQQVAAVTEKEGMPVS